MGRIVGEGYKTRRRWTDFNGSFVNGNFMFTSVTCHINFYLILYNKVTNLLNFI